MRLTARRFFVWVWRVNGLLVLCAAALGLVLVVWAVVDELMPRSRYHVARVDNDRLEVARVEFGVVESIEGTPVVRAPLRRVQAAGFGSGSGESTSVQNYLFIEPEAARSWWLVPGSDWVFLRDYQVPKVQFDERDEPPKAFLYEIATTDTNDDGRLDDDDALLLAISDPTGTRFTQLKDAVGQLSGWVVTGGRVLVILYVAGGEMRALRADVESHHVLGDAVVEPTSPPAAQPVGNGQQ